MPNVGARKERRRRRNKARTFRNEWKFQNLCNLKGHKNEVKTNRETDKILNRPNSIDNFLSCTCMKLEAWANVMRCDARVSLCQIVVVKIVDPFIVHIAMSQVGRSLSWAARWKREICPWKCTALNEKLNVLLGLNLETRARDNLMLVASLWCLCRRHNEIVMVDRWRIAFCVYAVCVCARTRIYEFMGLISEQKRPPAATLQICTK